MKKLITSVFILSAAFAFAESVTGVTARQRWPWNNLVDVDFTLAGTAGESYRVELSARSALGGTNYVAMTFASDPIVTAGTCRVTWDFGKDHPNVKVDDMLFTVTAAPASESTKPLYMVVDLAAGASAVSWPVRYTSVGPAHVRGARDEACQTTELWMRRISPPKTAVLYGNWKYSGNGYYAKQTKDYYIGVFELTGKQRERIVGSWADAYFTNVAYRASRPIQRQTIGSFTGGGFNPVAHPEKITSDSILGRLRKRTGLPFNLPTVVQLEYATRGGRVTEGFEYYTYDVNGSPAAANTIMRYKGNAGSYNRNSDDSVGIAAVGSYVPNAFGLYDMMGNVSELTCENPNEWLSNPITSSLSQYRTTAGDTTLGKSKDNPLVDPVGAWPGSTSSVYNIAPNPRFDDGSTSLFSWGCPENASWMEICWNGYGGRLTVPVE